LLHELEGRQFAGVEQEGLRQLDQFGVRFRGSIDALQPYAASADG
jgi:hypothetical protein